MSLGGLIGPDIIAASIHFPSNLNTLAVVDERRQRRFLVRLTIPAGAADDTFETFVHRFWGDAAPSELAPANQDKKNRSLTMLEKSGQIVTESEAKPRVRSLTANTAT